MIIKKKYLIEDYLKNFYYFKYIVKKIYIDLL